MLPDNMDANHLLENWLGKMVNVPISQGMAGKKMLRECLLDCSDDTRKVAREGLGLPPEHDVYLPKN